MVGFIVGSAAREYGLLSQEVCLFLCCSVCFLCLFHCCVQERKQRVVDNIYRFFKLDEAKNPCDYGLCCVVVSVCVLSCVLTSGLVLLVEMDWSTEYWSRGCYFAICPPGLLSECGDFLRKPHNLVHWAGSFVCLVFCLLFCLCSRIHTTGTETGRVWIGYIDGTLESGIRAADECIHAIRGAHTHGIQIPRFGVGATENGLCVLCVVITRV